MQTFGNIIRILRDVKSASNLKKLQYVSLKIEKK